MPEFSPATLMDRLAAALSAPAGSPVTDLGPGAPTLIQDGRVRCACGCWVQMWRVIDCRDIDPAISGGQAWACDGCWTRWVREGLVTRRGWVEAHGAPATVVAATAEHDWVPPTVLEGDEA